MAYSSIAVNHNMARARPASWVDTIFQREKEMNVKGILSTLHTLSCPKYGFPLVSPVIVLLQAFVRLLLHLFGEDIS